MKIEAYAMRDAHGQAIGFVVGTGGVQFVGPTVTRATPDPEPANREPAEHAIHSALDKVPADHPERTAWERTAFTLTAALQDAERACYDMEAAGYAADAQPDDVPWDDETTGWRADPIGRDDR